MRRTVVVAVLAAFAVAGCASVSNRQSVASYAQAAERVCARFNEEARTLPNPTTAAAARVYVDKTASIVRRQHDELAEIEPPPRQRVATRRGWLEAQNDFVATLEQQRERIVASVAPDAATRKLITGFNQGTLTAAQARSLASRFPSLADLADALDALGAKTVRDLPQEIFQRAAQRAAAETDQAKLQAALQPVNERLAALTRQIGATGCFGGGGG